MSQAAVAESITNLGGTFARSITQACTHLVTTPAELERRTAKIKAALSNPDVHLVALSWVEDSVAQNVKAAEDDHSVAPAAASGASGAGNSTATANSTTPTANGNTPLPKPNGKKTTKRSPSPDPAQSAPVKKQKTVSRSSAAVAAAPPPTVATDSKTKTKGNVASGTKPLHIPLDEGVGRPDHQVYVAPDGTIYDASLNQTNVGNNNNKFYRIQVLHQPSTGAAFTWTRWGRVGDFGQTASLGHGRLPDAIKQFEKKFKDKTGLAWDDRMSDPKPKKYTYLERSYDDSDDEDNPHDGGPATTQTIETKPPPPSTLEPATQDLMKLIFNQDFFNEAMKEMNYDVNKLPLGKLSKTTINRGYQALKDLSEVLDDPALAQTRYDTHLAAAAEQLSNAYYSLIPHAFGRNRPPVINSNAMLKREIELLESLSDMKDAAQILKVKAEQEEEDPIHPLDRQFQGLGLDEMTPLAPTSSEFSELQTYLCQSVGSTHGTQYSISSIFRIQRRGEPERFTTKFGSPQDRRLLWHGSRCTNFAGILSQGLRIAPPEAPVSGYMFGKGIYLADMSSKSANYCAAYASGGHALLLLCEAELGTPVQELTDADYDAGEKAKSKGMMSTWGQGMTGPKGWKDAGCVHESLEGVKIPDMSIAPGPTDVPGAYLLYNEYIVYDIAQVRLRYLLRVKL
ncbi:poly polymerase catalytic domain-containing protein [Coniochaeta sp. 2T2.1]|nr:poly polymerase catalytic domain-containing protein [Coniochaeta sp. 2T2.1]